MAGVVGTDKVAATVVLDNPKYSAPTYLTAGNYKQAVNKLTGDDASNYAVAAFTTALPNYTVIPLPTKSTVEVAALTSLPARGVATDRPIENNTSLANSKPAVKAQDSATPSQATAVRQDTANRSQTAAARPPNATPTNQVVASSSALTPKPIIFDRNIPTTSSIKSVSVQPPLGQRSLPSTKLADGKAANMAAPGLVMGLAEQDVDFEVPLPPMQAAPEVMASLESPNIAPENVSTVWEDRVYAGIREVLESPVTYQVLTGVSSVVFLVKTLVPGLLPAFQVPVNLPITPPANLPTQPGSMLSGRTSLGRWFGGA